MKTAIAVLLVLTGLAHAATELAPASRVRTVTNNYHILTGNVAQVNFNEIDGWLTNHSGRIDGATNLAQQAYDAVTGSSQTNIAALQEAFTLRTYVYTHTNSLEISTAAAGLTQFSVPAGSIGKIHPGMYVSNSAIFAATTAVTSVDWTNFVVNIDKTIIGSGTSTSCFAVATGSATAVTFTHVVPAGYKRCKITLTGGGGSGGCSTDVADDAAAGGGAGGSAIAFPNLSIGDSIAIAAGKRGARQTGSGNGNAGGTSSFGGYTTATGGAAGEGPTGLGGIGGTGSGGTINIRGGSGGDDNGSGETSFGGVSMWGGLSSEPTYDAPYGAGGTGGTTQNTPDNNSQAGNGIVVIEYY